MIYLLLIPLFVSFIVCALASLPDRDEHARARALADYRALNIITSIDQLELVPPTHRESTNKNNA
jgi:hypothetical protein